MTHRPWRAILALLVLGPLLLPTRSAHAQNLTAVLEAEIVTLDPHFTPAYITRTFGYMVFDTLFAMDGQARVQPQMVQDWTTSRRSDLDLQAARRADVA